jgi:hypothetical protein
MRENIVFEVGPLIYQQSAKKKNDIVCLRVIDSIHYKLPLMLLETYVATFGLFIL